MVDALTISGLDCFYGETQILYGLDLSLREGEVHCLLGRNGAGKTTTLKAIMGLAPARSGSIMLGGVDLTKLPAHEVPKAGVAYVPQGRRLFAEMTVAKNIEIGLMARDKGRDVRDAVLDYLPEVTRDDGSVRPSWPRIEDIDADLVFERQGLAVTARGARIFGTRTSSQAISSPHSGSSTTEWVTPRWPRR